MKKEFIYIAVIVLLVLAGIVYKSMFLSGEIEDTRELLKENLTLQFKFKRDSLVQEEAMSIRKIYNINKRDDRSYTEVIADLLNVTEDLLKESKIEYSGNDISQDNDEQRNANSGTTSFFININFATKYENVKKFLHLVEQNELIINVRDLNISRIKPSPTEAQKQRLEKKGLEFDEFNVKANLMTRIRLEFVKFL